MATWAWTLRADHLLLTVRLTPNAREDRIDGVKVLDNGKPVLVARVRAVPEDGAANAALEKLIARAVDVGRTRVSVVSGATQRIKILRIAGNPTALAERLAAQCG